MLQANKLLIFLHGKGADKSAHYQFAQNLAQKHNAELITFNAPSVYKNGYSWFSKTNGALNIPEFEHSIQYIKTKINEALEKHQLTYQDVILCGHSQGGMMSVYTGLMLNVAKIISICGDFIDCEPCSQQFNRETPIFWVEGGQDNYLNELRKDSYKILQPKTDNLHYIINANTHHNELDVSILSQIE